jgi:hypothetical protein
MIIILQVAVVHVIRATRGHKKLKDPAGADGKDNDWNNRD